MDDLGDALEYFDEYGTFDEDYAEATKPETSDLFDQIYDAYRESLGG